MAGHRHIDVVVIERVSRGAIDERRRQRRQTGLMADDAGLWRAAGLHQLVEQEPHQFVAGPGDRHTEIVENALPGELICPLAEANPLYSRLADLRARTWVRFVTSIFLLR